MYEKLHKYENVNKDLIDYLLSNFVNNFLLKLFF